MNFEGVSLTDFGTTGPVGSPAVYCQGFEAGPDVHGDTLTQPTCKSNCNTACRSVCVAQYGSRILKIKSVFQSNFDYLINRNRAGSRFRSFENVKYISELCFVCLIGHYPYFHFWTSEQSCTIVAIFCTYTSHTCIPRTRPLGIWA